MRKLLKLVSSYPDRRRAPDVASLVGDFPTYLTIGNPSAPLATLGFRSARGSALLVECYLSAPIEIQLEHRFGRAIRRERVVELGDFAADRSIAAFELARSAATVLAPQADIAVAILDLSLHAQLVGMGAELIEIVPSPAGSRTAAPQTLICAIEIAGFMGWLDRAASG